MLSCEQQTLQLKTAQINEKISLTVITVSTANRVGQAAGPDMFVAPQKRQFSRQNASRR
jgi:hypothetical protein